MTEPDIIKAPLDLAAECLAQIIGITHGLPDIGKRAKVLIDIIDRIYLDGVNDGVKIERNRMIDDREVHPSLWDVIDNILPKKTKTAGDIIREGTRFTPVVWSEEVVDLIIEAYHRGYTWGQIHERQKA